MTGQLSAREVCDALDAAVRATGPPKHLVTDQGPQFWGEYRAWCKGAGIKPRFGAIGKYGSIGIVERLNRTLKSEGLRRFLLPFRLEEMRTELRLFARWYRRASSRVSASPRRKRCARSEASGSSST